jgi:hypothetical protein
MSPYRLEALTGRAGFERTATDDNVIGCETGSRYSDTRRPEFDPMDRFGPSAPLVVRAFEAC